MSRLGYIARNPKRTVSALATLAVAASLTAGSGAYFADESASQGNAVEAGTVDITTFGSGSPVADANLCRSTTDAFEDLAGATADCDDESIATKEGTPTFQISNLTPGQSISRRFAVKNEQDVPVALRLSLTPDAVDGVASSDEGLAKAVRMDVTRLPGGGAKNYVNVVSQIAYPTILNVDGVVADSKVNIGDSPTRIALEPGETYVYELKAQLPETGENQNALMGKTLGFSVDVDAKSLAASGA